MQTKLYDRKSISGFLGMGEVEKEQEAEITKGHKETSGSDIQLHLLNYGGSFININIFIKLSNLNIYHLRYI